MFYSENFLAKKGPLANIWLAANWDRKLSKAQILHTDISSTIEDLVGGGMPPMALRLSGQLLLGVSKIYGRQAKYLLEDCGDALGKFQSPQYQEQQNTNSKNIHLKTIKQTINVQDLLSLEEKQRGELVEEFNVE
jgi:hypothetical protein